MTAEVPKTDDATTRAAGARRGFSITELLVVIGIIAVLITLLLVALGGATDSARETETESLMSQFSGACEQFQMEHNRYPGIVPDTALAAVPNLSSTELALLELMGGFDVFHATLAPDTDGSYAAFGGTAVALAGGWEIKIDVSLMGNGPVISGSPYAAYFTPRPEQLAVAGGQAYNDNDFGATDVPELVDNWGQPILYVRQMRPSGPLAGVAGSNARFLLDGMTPYLQSTQLGEMGFDQTGANADGSILNTAADPAATLAQILRNPAFGDGNDPLATGEPRGKFAMFSAGKDGIYFSRSDGPGSSVTAVDDIVTPGQPGVVDEYDDIRAFGGG